MTASSTLKLGCSLSSSPTGLTEATYILVQSFGQQRTRGYCPVGSVRLTVLVVALEEHHGPDFIEAADGGEVDVGNDGVEKEGEMKYSLKACVDEMMSSDAVQVIYIRSEAVEE